MIKPLPLPLIQSRLIGSPSPCLRQVSALFLEKWSSTRDWIKSLCLLLIFRHSYASGTLVTLLRRDTSTWTNLRSRRAYAKSREGRSSRSDAGSRSSAVSRSVDLSFSRILTRRSSVSMTYLLRSQVVTPDRMPMNSSISVRVLTPSETDHQWMGISSTMVSGLDSSAFRIEGVGFHLGQVWKASTKSTITSPLMYSGRCSGLFPSRTTNKTPLGGAGGGRRAGGAGRAAGGGGGGRPGGGGGRAGAA